MAMHLASGEVGITYVGQFRVYRIDCREGFGGGIQDDRLLPLLWEDAWRKLCVTSGSLCSMRRGLNRRIREFQKR